MKKWDPQNHYTLPRAQSKGAEKLRKHPEIALLNHLMNFMRTHYPDNSNREHVISLVLEIKKILRGSASLPSSDETGDKNE